MTGDTVSRSASASDILSVQVRGTSHSRAVSTRSNTCVGTKWVLVAATYSPPGGQSELEFRIRDGVVGRERSVSRVRCSPIRTGPFEYRTISNDTPQHNAVGY